MRRPWRQTWLGRLLRRHSPSGHMSGNCWCIPVIITKPITIHNTGQAHWFGRYICPDCKDPNDG